MSIATIKKAIEDARAAYGKDSTWVKSQAVKTKQAELSAAITEGAQPCPLCKQVPHGIEQPAAGGKSVEYEIGCLGCKPIKHTDGTMRRPAVRGGLLAKHAVEAWNAGPDHWLKT